MLLGLFATVPGDIRVGVITFRSNFSILAVRRVDGFNACEKGVFFYGSSFAYV